MPVFSSSRLGVTPGRLIAALSLEEIGAKLLASPPDGTTLTEGWRAGTSGDGMLGSRYATPPVTPLVALEATSPYPRRIHVRYFYYTRSRDLERYAESDDSDIDVSILGAVDVLICETDTSFRYDLLFSSANENWLTKAPIASMNKVLKQAAPNSDATIRDSFLNFDEPDIYLWLMICARDQKSIDADARLTRIDAVSGQDVAKRVTAMTRGVDFDRPSFLVSVAEVERLGPMRLRVSDSRTGGRFGFDLNTNGVFSPQKGLSSYREPSADFNEGMRSSLDLAFSIIPRIVAAYTADENWKTKQKAAEVIAAARSLIARYQRMYPDLEESPDSESTSP